MSNLFDGNNTLANVMWVLTSVAAVNWGLVEFNSTNLVGEVASATSPAVGTALYALIAISGVLTLLDNLGLYEVTEVIDGVLN